jgi:hypothetical protein
VAGSEGNTRCSVCLGGGEAISIRPRRKGREGGFGTALKVVEKKSDKRSDAMEFMG